MNSEDIQEGRINDQLGSQLEGISAQVEANIERGRNALAEWKTSLAGKTRDFQRTMDRYSHEHPWRMVSSALIAGILLGTLCGWERPRRRRRF